MRAIADIWSAFKEFNTQALIFGFAAAIIYSLIVIIVNVSRHAKGRQFLSAPDIAIRLVLFTLFGIYCSYAISLTLSGREAGSRTGYLNIIPGSTIMTNGTLSAHSIENWLLFVPFGMLVPMLWGHSRSLARTGFLALLSSILIEAIQLVTQRGYFEIDDVILNTLGGLCGYILFACIYDGFLGLRKRIVGDVATSLGKEPLHGSKYERFALRHEWALFIINLIPVVLTVDMIMGFSKETGSVSRQASRPVAFVAAKIIGFVKGSGIPELAGITKASDIMDISSEYLDMIERVIRKCAHLTEYAILAFFVWVLIYSRRKIKRKAAYIISVVLVAAVGICDEINQSSTVGRYGSPVDVCLDVTGAVIVLGICAIIVRLVMNYYYSHPDVCICNTTNKHTEERE